MGYRVEYRSSAVGDIREWAGVESTRYTSGEDAVRSLVGLTMISYTEESDTTQPQHYEIWRSSGLSGPARYARLSCHETFDEAISVFEMMVALGAHYRLRDSEMHEVVL